MYQYDSNNKRKEKKVKKKKENNAHLVQRMVVHSEPVVPKDMNIIAGLPVIKDKMGGPVLSIEQSRDYAKENKIGFLAHGGPGFIKWGEEVMTGEAFVRNELVPRHITLGTVVSLWSCGAGEKKGPSENTSLVNDVARALGKGIGIAVEGVKGASHIVFPDGEHFQPRQGLDIGVFRTKFTALRMKWLIEKGFCQYESQANYVRNLRKFLNAPDDPQEFKTFSDMKLRKFMEAVDALKRDPDFLAIADKVEDDMWERDSSRSYPAHDIEGYRD